jgi:hypothetical protein
MKAGNGFKKWVKHEGRGARFVKKNGFAKWTKKEGPGIKWAKKK